jgi:hypothetical protein
MFDQVLVGSIASICNVTIHALVMLVVIRVANAVGRRRVRSPSLLIAATMIATVLVLMAAHTLEVLVWAIVYFFVDLAPPGANLVYFAFVNYTTLGYGDLIPAAQWQLLGPIAAMNGVLMFGWSTAVIFEVLRAILARVHWLRSP